MTIGSLGGLVFTVSDRMLQSFMKLDFSGSAKIQNHELHLTKAKPEFTGSEPDKATLTVRVSKLLGCDPAGEIAKVKAYCDSGAVLRLQLGRSGAGNGRWMITGYKVTWQDTDRYGNVTDAEITLNLQEYV